MGFGGKLGDFIYHEVLSPVVQLGARINRGAVDVVAPVEGGYLGQLKDKFKHQMDLQIENPARGLWQGAATIAALYGLPEAMQYFGGSGGAGAFGGWGAPSLEAGAGAAGAGGADALGAGALGDGAGAWGMGTGAYPVADAAGGLGAGYYPGIDAAGGLAPQFDGVGGFGSFDGLGQALGAGGPMNIGDYIAKLSNFGKGGWGQPALKTLNGLYQLAEAQKLKQASKLPSYDEYMGSPAYQAGLDAVSRRMAASGYLGSGNLLTALRDQGQQGYLNYAAAKGGTIANQAGAGLATGSSLALLANGLGGF